MKFAHKNSTIKKITDQIILYEYCENASNLPIDGAYAKIDGLFGPKRNKSFTELFFVISGKLQLEVEGVMHELNEKDMYIVPPNTKHKMVGADSEVFIACSPQFNEADVEYCD